MRFLNYFSIFAAVLSAGLCGCVSNSPEPSDPAVKPEPVYQVSAEIAALGVKTLPTAKNLTLVYTDQRTLVLTPGSMLTKWQDISVQLPQAPVLDENNCYQISEASLRILGALFKNPEGKHFGRHIMLDAGHGGNDTGAKGAFSLEKDLNLAMALELEKELLARGFVVLLTRGNDVFITLADRCRIAEKADIFISLHHNAATNSSATGLETYAPELRKQNYSASVVLAFLIQRRIVEQTGERDRGMKTNNYFVLENTTCPAVLVEAGFISNPEEEKLLNDAERRRKVVVAIADAVEEFYLLNGSGALPEK